MARKTSMGRVNPNYLIPRQLPNEVARSRLLKRLEAANDAKLIALVGPSGFGKTTVLAQWARTTPGRSIWISLASDDADALALSRTVVSAVKSVIPVELAAWDRVAAMSASNESLAGALASDLNRLPENMRLFFDGADYLSDGSSRWLLAFMDALGEGHQIVVSQHDNGPLNLVRHVNSGMAMVVSSNDLAFSVDETETLLSNAGSDLNAHELFNARAGWPAGIALATHGAEIKLTADDLILDIVSRLPQDIQQTLPEVATLEVWSEDFARGIGASLPNGWLLAVARAGLPLTALDSHRYRPHQSVLDALERQLSKNPDRHAALHIAAARKAEAAGALLAATHHLHVAGRIFEAIRLAEELLPRWEQRADWTLVLRVLEPLGIANLSPRLRTGLGIAMLETGRGINGETTLQKEISSGQATGLTFFGLSLAAYRRGEFTRALELADEGMEIATEQREIVQLLRSKIVARASLGELDQAFDLAQECINRAERLGDPGLFVSALGVFAFVLEKKDDIERAIVIYHRSIDIAFASGFPNKALATVDRLACIYRKRGNFNEARSLTNQMLEIGESDYPLAMPWMFQRRGDIAVAEGEFESALADLERGTNLFLQFGNLCESAGCSCAMVYPLLRLGKMGDAQNCFSKAVELFNGVPEASNLYESEISLAKAHIHFFSSEYDFAERALLAIHPTALFDGYATVQAYLAEIARSRGMLEQSHITSIIEALDQIGNDESLRTEIGVLDGLYEECVRRGWYVKRFQPMITNAPKKYVKRTSIVLQIETLGRVFASINDQPISFPYAKVMELLIYLVVNREATRDVIAQDLWPEAEHKRRVANAHQAIRRLRIAFGDALPGSTQIIELLHGSYRFRDDVEIQADILDLRMVAPANGEDVLERYKGEFVPGASADWVLEARGNFATRAASIAMNLAEMNEPYNPAEAIRFCRRAVEIAPDSAEAFSMLERLFDQTGNSAGVNAAQQALRLLAQGEIPRFSERIVS